MDRDREAFEAWAVKRFPALPMRRDEEGNYYDVRTHVAYLVWKDWQAALAYVRGERVEWRPIETAPKDGTRVDLFIDGSRHTDCYWGFPDHCCGEAGQYCDSDWHRLKQGWVDGTFNEPLEGDDITHWRPLPLPPSPVTESSGCVFRDLNMSPPEREEEPTR